MPKTRHIDRDYSPNDRQETGGSLASRDEVGQGDKGQGKSRLVEEHGEMERLTRVGTTGMGSHSESGRVNLKLVIVAIVGSLRTVVMLKSD